MIRDELIDGGKIYLVYPIIEESEQSPQLHAAKADFGTIKQKFDGYPCGLLHGRMRSDEKDEVLSSFRSGETRILLSTQVIEIGVDVPDASMMVVMNAERFGVAQLHQLRGRVGRGERKSRCIFLSSTSSTLPRLKVLEKSSDGFYLANADLLLRGPGNLLGKKQSGHLPEFPIARLEIDGGILQEAHLAALVCWFYELGCIVTLKSDCCYSRVQNNYFFLSFWYHAESVEYKQGPRTVSNVEDGAQHEATIVHSWRLTCTRHS